MNDSSGGGNTLIKPDILRRIVDHCQRIEEAYLSGKTVDLDLLAREFQGADRDFAKSQFDQVLERLRRNFPHCSPSPQEGVRPRFEKAELLTQGGMGQLWIAVDLEFNRKVALKEIVPSSADNEAYRQRFLSEAEITGRLEHPGIVPVYSLGHHADGRPYYAMRLITGEDTGTLQQAIERLHAEGKLSSEQFEQGTRELLGRLVNVCETIAYAHGRGVLHRDLKPANILLGPYGETLVVDWGLARTFTPASEETVTDSAQDLKTTAPVSQFPHSVTGSILGTPGFAAPEQMGHIASDSDQTTMVTRELKSIRRGGPWSDIYSLGAILYHILTGQSPLRAASSGGSSLQDPDSRITDAPRPRAMRPDIPKALEAICLKAMERDPRRRYPNAMSLSLELKKYLSGDPVEAWVEPLPVRVSRWFDKHRTISATTTFAMVLTIPLLAFVSMTQSRLRSRYQTSSEELKKVVAQKEQLEGQLRQQYLKAVEREDVAIQAIQSFRDMVVHTDEFNTTPETMEAKRKLLESPIKFFKSFREMLEAEGSLSDQSRLRLAMSTLESGKLAQENSSSEDAIEYYKEAINLLDSLTAVARLGGKDSAELKLDHDLYRARAHRLIHEVQLQRGDFKQAEIELRNAAQFIEPLQQSASERSDVQLELTELKLLVAIREQASGDTDYAASLLAEVRDQLKDLQSKGDNPEVLRQLIKLRNAQVQHLRADGQLAAAGRELRGLIGFLEETVDQESLSDPILAQELAKAYTSESMLLAGGEDSNQTIISMNRSVELYRKLMARNPGSQEYQAECSNALARLAELLQEKDVKRSIDLMKEAISINQNIRAVDPNSVMNETALMKHIHRLGHLLQIDRRVEEAHEAFGVSFPIATKLVNQLPDAPGLLREQLEIGEHLVQYELSMYQLEPARQRLVRLIEGRERLSNAPHAVLADRLAHKQGLKQLILIDERLGNGQAKQWRTKFRELTEKRLGAKESYEKLEAVERGFVPENPSELASLATMAADLQDFPLAFDLYRKLYELSPDVLEQPESPLLMNGVMSAIRTADMDPERSDECYRLAMVWTRQFAKGLQQLRSSSPVKASQLLDFWRQSPELATVVRPEELAKFPEGEKEEWDAIWKQVSEKSID
ncbi:MAG: protein kinase domain-containing protein [Pirellulaceae bacterium]